MQSNKTHTLIFSVHQDDKSTAENFKAYTVVEGAIREADMKYEELVIEDPTTPIQAFAVYTNSDKLMNTLAFIRKMALHYNQESIIHIDSEGTAFEDDLFGDPVKMGPLLEAGTVKPMDTHIFNLTTQQYWIIERTK